MTSFGLALGRAGAEFLGVPTTFRSGRNKEANIVDLVSGKATLWQYLASKEIKKK